MAVMTSGTLASRTGLSVKAVREFADIGLIYTVGRSASGYRLFGDEALWCAQMISGLRSLGLTIAEIRTLADSAEPVGPRLARALATARKRTSGRIDELRELLARIDAFEAEHRAELAGNVEFDTGDPRRDA